MNHYSLLDIRVGLRGGNTQMQSPKNAPAQRSHLCENSHARVIIPQVGFEPTTFRVETGRALRCATAAPLVSISLHPPPPPSTSHHALLALRSACLPLLTLHMCLLRREGVQRRQSGLE
nr:hypothetical protein HmN_000315100 [Hymenolepis microstoma]CUU98526.1 hypothetical transcript [Hymenolepis microstoma]CUU99699.1 hypothetical transcript [Hymenolepis microstoma]